MSSSQPGCASCSSFPPARQTSLTICLGRKRFMIGTNQLPIAQPGP